MTKKQEIFTVDHGTYPFDVLVCIGHNHKEICDYFKKRKLPISEAEKEALWMKGRGRTLMLSGGQIIIRIDRLPRPAFHATVAHEVFHAVEFLFDRVNIKHDLEKSGEAFAYQIGYLTEQIYKKVR